MNNIMYIAYIIWKLTCDILNFLFQFRFYWMQVERDIYIPPLRTDSIDIAKE